VGKETVPNKPVMELFHSHVRTMELVNSQNFIEELAVTHGPALTLRLRPLKLGPFSILSVFVHSHSFYSIVTAIRQ
jgi:hypothetical protein